MLGDYFTKPQQGAKMRRSRSSILNICYRPTLISQECVGTQCVNKQHQRKPEAGKNNRTGVINRTGIHIPPMAPNTGTGTIQNSNMDSSVKNDICDPVCDMSDDISKGNTNANSHSSSRYNNIMRRKTGSYLMAAKGLLNKANQRDHFIQLTQFS